MFNLDSLKEVKVIKQSERQKTILLEDNKGKKYLKRELNSDKREIYKLLQKINHPNIPKVYYVGFDDKTIVVEEYIEGESLNALIERQGILRKRQICLIAKQILLALEQLHGVKIIHRDVKPDNILIDEAKHVWLVDFDIARIYRNEVRKDTEAMGTFGYAPIEQFGMLPTDFTTDIYAFGVTLKMLLDYSKSKGSLYKIAEKCKRLDPSQRYKSAKAVRRAFFWNFKKCALKCIVAMVAVFIIIFNFISSQNDMNENTNQVSVTKPEEKPEIKEIKQEDIPKKEIKQEDVLKKEIVIPENEPEVKTKEPEEAINVENVELEGDFFGFEEGSLESKYAGYQHFASAACIFTTYDHYYHLFFIEDINKKGRIRFGKTNSLIDADVTLSNGTLDVTLSDGLGNTFSKQFKYDGQYAYNRLYEGDLRKNADIICHDFDNDGYKELLIALNESAFFAGEDSVYGYSNYCIGWCIRYDEDEGFILCEGDMFSEEYPFWIYSGSHTISLTWIETRNSSGYGLEGNKIIEAY